MGRVAGSDGVGRAGTGTECGCLWVRDRGQEKMVELCEDIRKESKCKKSKEAFQDFEDVSAKYSLVCKLLKMNVHIPAAWMDGDHVLTARDLLFELSAFGCDGIFTLGARCSD